MKKQHSFISCIISIISSFITIFTIRINNFKKTFFFVLLIGLSIVSFSQNNKGFLSAVGFSYEQASSYLLANLSNYEKEVTDDGVTIISGNFISENNSSIITKEYFLFSNKEPKICDIEIRILYDVNNIVPAEDLLNHILQKNDIVRKVSYDYYTMYGTYTTENDGHHKVVLFVAPLSGINRLVVLFANTNKFDWDDAFGFAINFIGN